MSGRFIGADGDERGRICPAPKDRLISVRDEAACRERCTARHSCKYYTYFPASDGNGGLCAVSTEEECESMISASFATEKAVSREKVYDLSVDEAIIASDAGQCWAKDVKSEAVESMLITPEFKGSDHVKDSSRCVLLGERDVCARIRTVEDPAQCPSASRPCYAGYRDGCAERSSADGLCPTLPIPRDRRAEVLKSVKEGRIECEMARSRTECSVIDDAVENAFHDDYAVVDPVEGIPIETLFLSDESGERVALASSSSSSSTSNRPLPQRYGRTVLDFADNAKVMVGERPASVKCTVPLDSNTYLMMLDSAEGIDVEKGIVEHSVTASGERNVSMRLSGGRCRSSADCAPTETDEIVCEMLESEDSCNLDPLCAWDGELCRAKHGKCDLTGEYSCQGGASRTAQTLTRRGAKTAPSRMPAAASPCSKRLPRRSGREGACPDTRGTGAGGPRGAPSGSAASKSGLRQGCLRQRLLRRKHGEARHGRALQRAGAVRLWPRLRQERAVQRNVPRSCDGQLRRRAGSSDVAGLWRSRGSRHVRMRSSNGIC